jgi:FAD/FMN-containing dehydrogenase
MPNISELKKIVGAKHVLDDPEDLSGYASDLSFVAPIRPLCVVRPKNSQEVQKITKWANKTLTPLVPISSGPPHFFGDTVPGVGGAVVVDLSRMKNIRRIDPINRVALVEPGVTFAELQAALKEKGLSCYMPFAPRSSKSVVGSMLERQPITMPNDHFDASDPMLCAEIVFGTGDTLRTGEAAGPDTIEEQWEYGKCQMNPTGPTYWTPSQLVTGAQGTIGFVTWASLKCHPLSKVSRTLMVASETIEPLIDLNYQLVKARLGNHCFILNGVNLACLTGKDAAEVDRLKSSLPPWVLIVSFEGDGELPLEKVTYQEADFRDMVSRYCPYPSELTDRIAGVTAEQISGLLSLPSEGEYWKLRYKGGCQDILFLTTLDKTPGFIGEMSDLCAKRRYPVGNIGVYLQMLVQGTSCHCEFNVYYDPARQGETDGVKWLVTEGAQELRKKGAFFSRPYGSWAKMAYTHACGTAMVQRKVKGIFDPKGILNPGKLCF